MRYYADEPQGRPRKDWHFDVHAMTDAGNSMPIRFKASCATEAEVRLVGQLVAKAYSAPWRAWAEGEPAIEG